MGAEYQRLLERFAKLVHVIHDLLATFARLVVGGRHLPRDASPPLLSDPSNSTITVATLAGLLRPLCSNSRRTPLLHIASLDCNVKLCSQNASPHP